MATEAERRVFREWKNELRRRLRRESLMKEGEFKKQSFSGELKSMGGGVLEKWKWNLFRESKK